MNVMRTFAIAFITFAISGCALDISSNSNGRCSVSSPCQSPAAPVCYRGFCVAGDATVPPSDAGIDAAMVDGGADGGLDANADVGLDANADSGIDVGIDGGCDAGSTTCSTGLPGACATGRAACGNMCIPPMPMTERCGGGDLDCDGTIDEESNVRCYPAATMGCVRQADGSFRCAGACRTGTQTCSGGTLGLCSGAVTPAGAEQCTTAGGTAFDEDCDGTIDEGCSCTNAATQPCFPGAPSQAGVGVCRNGTQTCATMMWGACAASGMPSPETCMNQGADNDCDGIIDDIPGGGATCPIAAQMGVCAAGTMQCMGGSLACVGPTPVPEICNHLDDDCDGSVDESFAFASDGANCGGCGHACGTGSTCCNGVCVDESSNATHCGSCLMTCGGQSCCSSMCADTMSDRNNCGACGNVCSGSQLCCTGRCIDPLRDATNCATCGHACGGATSACCGGSCVAPTAPACTGCQVDCSTLTPTQACCSNSCVDRMTDEQNCGTCGHACAAGQVCCGGSCFADDALHCGGACAACTSALCSNDACVPIDTRHCQACGVTCASGSACCADGCQDLTASNTDCGMCGAACTGAAPHCTNGHCCATGTSCANVCVNVNTDANNCGSCGHRCALGCNGSGACNLF